MTKLPTVLSIVRDNTLNDLKGHDGRLVFFTQTVLILFLLTLTLSAASIQAYLQTNLEGLLGADLVLESHEPLPQTAEDVLFAEADGVSKTELISITMTHGETWQRVQLKLVDNAYPLQGALTVGTSPASQSRTVERGPVPGEIWLGPRLAVKLGTGVGDILTLGTVDLRVSAILFHEPDRLMEGHSVALRAMVHADSLDTAGVDGGDRRLRYLITADAAAEGRIESWAGETLPAARLVKKRGGSHPLALFWKRTENFLGIASIILVFMAAVAIDMTNRRWLARIRYRLALYAGFGVGLATGVRMAGLQWLTGFAVAFCVGAVGALAAHALIVQALQVHFPGLAFGWHMGAVLKTAALVFCLLLLFQTPAFVQLRHASILALVRAGQIPPDQMSSGQRLWFRLISGLAGLGLVAAVYSDNWLLTGLVLGAFAAAIAVMMAVTWGVLNLGDVWGRRRAGFLPFAFFIMKQRIFSKSAQILGLGLCALMLLFTLMLMRDLGATMQAYSRTHDGNLLIADTRADQMDAVRDWAARTGSAVRQLRPFVGAQLVAVNDTALADHMRRPSDTLSALQDPVRLSWTDTMPDNNQLAGGTWWPQATPRWQQISAEAEVMTDLGLSYGDRLTFRIGGQSYRFELAATHRYRPGHGSITFWFQVPASARAHISADTRYMGSMELPATAWPALAGLWRRYPTLSLVPLRDLTERFDRTLAMVTRLTTGFAGMVLVLAVIVLAASISGFEADDRRKNGLLMSMGLTPGQCLKLNLYDWAVTALIAALGGVAGTWIAGVLIYRSQFGLVYKPDVAWTLGMAAAMVIIVCVVGRLAARRSLRASVRDLLVP